MFASVVNNIHFKLKPFIVFFNKRDLFEEKIKKKNIRSAFPDYEGDNSFEDTKEFIITKFTSQSKVWKKSQFFFQKLKHFHAAISNTFCLLS